MQTKAQKIVIDSFKADWEEIPFRAPVGWETTMGYKGNGRFVSLYWCNKTYEVIIYDGASRCNGIMKTWFDWSLSYPEICLHLGDRTFGYLFEPATHTLLIDRFTHSTYIAKLGMLVYVPMNSTLNPAIRPP
jgi:hypothetical protein